MSKEPDVTAVVLNWARLENVKVIVADLCSEELRDTISSVIVWNNQPKLALSDADFEVANAPKGMLKIVNSSENLYFQARFLACVDASTHWCFVQDDDYLVSTEAIRALRKYSRLNQKPDNEHPIHLLPPHEHLSTTIRTHVTEKSVASFAWLGHGTLLTRTHARTFLDLLASLSNKQDDVMKMADNFFSILFNRRAEIWVDPGKHLRIGEEQAFTVGVEGDERNWTYIRLAEEYLRQITSHPGHQALNKFTAGLNEPSPNDELIIYAPSLAKGSLGVWSTNIPMLPRGVLEAGAAAKDLRSADTLRRSAMGADDLERYIRHPLSCVGDGLSSTSFRSPAGCQEGQWLSFDFLEERTLSELAFKWVVEPTFAEEITQMSYEVLEKGQGWTNVVMRSSTQTSEAKFVVQLELGHRRTLVAARVVIEAGPPERPAWGVVACVVETV